MKKHNGINRQKTHHNGRTSRLRSCADCASEAEKAETRQLCSARYALWLPAEAQQPESLKRAWDQGEVGFSSGFIAARSSVRNIWNRPCWKPGGGTMKKSLLLLFLLAIGGGLNTAEAQPLPVRVGYTALSGAFSPLWMAKELGLFARQGIQSTPIYMASNLADQAMLAGETDFTVGTGIAPVQSRLGGADPLIVVTYISGFNFAVIARPPFQQPGELRGKRIGVLRFGGGTDFGARLALKRWGLVPVKDVTIIQLGGYPEAFAALKGDSVQVAVLTPPFSTEAKRLGMVELLDFNHSDIEFTGVGLRTRARYESTRGEGNGRGVTGL